jgi:hypothetical protein
VRSQNCAVTLRQTVRWRDVRSGKAFACRRAMPRLSFSTAPLKGAPYVLAVMLLAGHVIAQVAPAVATRGGEVPGPLPVFPPDNWWNQDISAAPVDPGSAQFINGIGVGRGLHPDFGGYDVDNPAYIYGIPYVVVGGDQPKQTVQFYYPHQSDGVTHPGNQSFDFYPIPEEAKTESYWIEGGPPGSANPGGDRHMLILDRDNRHLYELFDLHWSGTQWQAGSGAFFDLDTNDRRPEGWTSADAAGLAIFPGLVRYDEVFGPDEIRHALRVTVQNTNGYVWPASHVAGDTPGALPMGARMRLKSTVNLAPFPPAMQKIFRAMQRYGLIVADNGSNMYVTGTFDPRWNNEVLNPAFAALKAGDFEIVQLGWRGPSAPCTSPSTPTAFAASVSGFRVTLSWSPPSGASVQSYAIEVGHQPGAANLGSFTLPSTQTMIAADAPSGNYHLRVRAQNACGSSAPSADAHAIVPSGCAVPGAPGQPTAVVNGPIVSLVWGALAGVSSYVLEVGSASGLSDLLQAVVNGTGITGAAPPGLYYARVRGQNACGTGPASPERVVSLGGCTPPAPAGPLTSAVSGNLVTLHWPGMPGAAAYRIEVGSAPDASNLLITTVATNIVSAPAPPGVYHVRVRGAGACGVGAATNEVSVSVS